MTLHWVVLARWALGGTVAALGTYIVAFNWVTIPWNSRLASRGEKRHISTVPIVGPLLMSVGAIVALGHPTVHVAWLWLADWATCTLPIWILLANRRS
jgi:hypothetical protein